MVVPDFCKPSSVEDRSKPAHYPVSFYSPISFINCRTPLFRASAEYSNSSTTLRADSSRGMLLSMELKSVPEEDMMLLGLGQKGSW